MTYILASSPFQWATFDVSSRLAPRWADDLLDIAKKYAVHKELRPTSVTSREHSRDLRIPVLTVGGVTLRAQAPWLDRLYRTEFLQLGRSTIAETLYPAEDQRYAINLNIQRGQGMRYECHLDSNPIEGILYATTHPPGQGGELVISNEGDVVGVEAVTKNASRIYPVRGHLVFFDARARSHYVEALKSESDFRVAVTMNFYTPSCPESSRPPDLSRHLGLE